MPNDIEAYVKTSDPDAVISLLSSVIGPLAAVSPESVDPRFYEFETTLVLVGTSQDEFLSVCIPRSTFWTTSPALARFLAANLDCVVRCDPGKEFPEISPYSDFFLQIEGGVESIVCWG